VTGEVTGAHKKLADEPFLNVKANLYTFMGGPRFFVKRGRVVPFAQFLAGAAHLRAKATVPIQGVPSVTESDTQFAFQPGAGLTVLLTRNVGVRAAVDYRRIIFNETDDDEDNSEVRGIVGVVFGWGAR
jgi:opacity protein-like surface antigen